MTDRTSELMKVARQYQGSVTDTYKNRFQTTSDIPTMHLHFLTESTNLHYSLQDSFKQLDQLKKMISNISLFMNQSPRIQQLSNKIEDNIKVAQLKMEEMMGVTTDHDCGQAILDILQQRLFVLIKEFKLLLQQRTKSLKKTEAKRNKLAVSSTIETQSLEVPSFISTVQSVEQVEKQLSEIQEMFQRLSFMVAQQGETIERIDSNTDMALVNLERGKVEIETHYRNVTNNRNLMIKAFLIFVAFFSFYVVFLLQALPGKMVKVGCKVVGGEWELQDQELVLNSPKLTLKCHVDYFGDNLQEFIYNACTEAQQKDLTLIECGLGLANIIQMMGEIIFDILPARVQWKALSQQGLQDQSYIHAESINEIINGFPMQQDEVHYQMTIHSNNSTFITPVPLGSLTLISLGRVPMGTQFKDLPIYSEFNQNSHTCVIMHLCNSLPKSIGWAWMIGKFANGIKIAKRSRRQMLLNQYKNELNRLDDFIRTGRMSYLNGIK